MSNEEQIVAGVLAGNTAGFRLLVERYHRPVFRFACTLIGDEHEAEDLAQEVFLSAFDNLANYDANRGQMLTWLFAMTRNRCVNHLKRKRPLVVGADIPTPQPTNLDSARNEFWRSLDMALDALPIDQKTAFVLAEIENLPYATIAQIEQTNIGTVKSRIHRAKLRLRIALAPKLGDE